MSRSPQASYSGPGVYTSYDGGGGGNTSYNGGGGGGNTSNYGLDSSVSSAPGMDTSLDRIAALKRIQRRSHMSPHYPVNDPQDGFSADRFTETPQKKTDTSAFAPHLRSVTKFVRSAMTEHNTIVDRGAILSLGGEGLALSELLEEVAALKQRDSSAAGVLKLAKDNLDQRQRKIHELSSALERTQMELTEAQAGHSHKEALLDRSEAEILRNRNHEEEVAAKQRDVAELQRALAERERVMASLFRQAKDEWESAMEGALIEQRGEANKKIAALERELDLARGQPMAPSEVEEIAEGQSEETLRQTLREHMATIRMMQEKMAVDTMEAKAKEEEIGDLRADLAGMQDAVRGKNTDLESVHHERRKHETSNTEKDHLLTEHRGQLEEVSQLAEEQRQHIQVLEERIVDATQEHEKLRQAQEVIEELERRQHEMDELVEGVREERFHMDEIISELKQKRIQMQQKDALIAELNEQMHATDALAPEKNNGASLFKQQQLQRDLQELRTAVHQRDQLITELSSRLQLQGGGDVVRDSQLAERERIISAQTQQLQLVSQHQFDMQAQLAAVQKALQEQQELLLAKAEEHARQQENSFQLAAQSQQLAALQEGLNQLGSGGRGEQQQYQQQSNQGRLQVDVGGDRGSSHARTAPSSQIKASSIIKAPTPGEWSKNQGSDAATEHALKARTVARSAAAAAAVARHESGLTVALPTEVTM